MSAKFRLLVALVLLTACFAPSARAAAPADPARERAWDAPHVSNELLVKLPVGHSGRFLPGGLVIVRQIPALGLALVRMPSGKSLAQAAAELTDAAAVEWAEPNYTLGLDFVPNDPFYASPQTPYLDNIGAAAAWDHSTGRPETVIAVLDTGFDMLQEDLAGAFWTNELEASGEPDVDDDGNGFVDDIHGWDFASGDNDPSDDHGHGTHVAGIAAARIDNGKGIAGMAGRTTIMPVDVFQGGIGTYEALIRAIIYATDNGADVINMSLGASSYSKGEEAAVDYAYAHGVVVVAAAGNTGYTTRPEQRHYPAAHAHVIAVASTTAADTLSGFSTRGDWVDVAAPGDVIYSTYRGLNPSTGRHDNYASMSGTSMASPHVAGLAALILSRNPMLTPDQVRAIIESTAKDRGPTGRDIYFGAGRIDAGRALAATPPSDAPPPIHTPGPGLNMDLPGCIELMLNGGFEGGGANWELSGATGVVTSPTSSGQGALKFAGGPGAAETGSTSLSLPQGATAAVLRFDYRIEPKDFGQGASSDWPFDDWFTAEWQTADGAPLGQLLRTGNTADTVSGGLQWDHYLYRLEASDLAALGGGPLKLVFRSQNDADAYPTDVWLDGVSFCAAGPTRTYLPLVMQ